MVRVSCPNSKVEIQNLAMGTPLILNNSHSKTESSIKRVHGSKNVFSSLNVLSLRPITFSNRLDVLSSMVGSKNTFGEGVGI